MRRRSPISIRSCPDAPPAAADLLAWPPEPLATAEVALVMGVDVEAGRRELQAVGRFEAAGADGYWTLRS